MSFSTRRRRPSVRALAGTLTIVVAAALLPAAEQVAAAADYQPLKPQAGKLVPTVNAPDTSEKRVNPAAARALRTPTATALPGPGSATVAVGTPAATATVGTLPVTIADNGAKKNAAGTTKVKVDVLDPVGTPWAGKEQVLLRLTRADGGAEAREVAVRFGYSAFRNAAGADYGSRLHVERLPECALATPDAPACAATPVPSANSGDGWVGATVSAAPDASKAGAPGGLYALAAGPSGSAGSFAATSLSPSGTWEAGGPAGDFTWSYPLRTPPSLGGPAPSLGLSYSAQSVDGKSAATNNQPSWIGEGFEMWSGYVERSYRSCADDTDGPGANNKDHKTGDQCWATDNATMSLNGKTVELIKDDKTGAWHPRQDDGSRIEHLTGAGNGARNGEHWKITTANGTQYWFGLNRIPGWTANARETNSTWTAPVFGNNPGEPCNLTTFAASYCTQAWRWNLDYVQDPHGNSMSYWYTKELSHYGKNLTPTNVSEYVRGGTLNEIHYGTRPSITSGTGSNFAVPPMQVTFGTADRCLPGKPCDIGQKANWPNWPDVPWDQYCASTTNCAQTGPTFFTQKRLSTITTQVLSGTALKNVEQWTLKHTYPDPGDGTRAGLWLDAIAHTGLDVPAGQPPTNLPDVSFDGTQLDNRVDTDTDNRPAMKWWRISAIHTETGGRIAVAYSPPECKTGSAMPSSPDTNSMRCYPVKWTPEGYTDPITDWFHKYVVIGVTEADKGVSDPTDVVGSRIKETHYAYLGGAAWHYVDDNGIITAKDKTWSVWRGYERVRVTEGAPGEETSGETLYYRGIDGDKTYNGTPKSRQLTDSQGGKVADSDVFAGMAREQISANGNAEVSGAISDMWASTPTATRTINGDTVAARYTGVGSVHKRTDLDGGRSLLKNTVTTTYDAYGMVTKVDDTGDQAKNGDEKCVTTSYARNTSAWLMSYVSQVQTLALPCGQNPTTAVQVLGDGRTYFDGQGFGTAPTKGDVTQIEGLKDWAGGTPAYLVDTKSSYDAYGRVTDSWDVRNNQSHTAYTPTSGGPLTRTVSTNPLNWITTVDYNPANGAMLSQLDPNNRRTDLAYDGLGRLVSVWQPGRDKATQTPSTTYAYTIRATGVNTVTSSSINSNAGQITTYTIYDGLLRPRQSQAAAVGSSGGRLVTDTFYDSAGRVSVENGIYAATGAPGPDLATYTDQNLIPSQTRTSYDAAGRPTTSTVGSLGTELWRTTAAYGGDHTDVTPPQGATPTSTYTDIYDRTTEIRQYHGSTPTGAFDATKYTYNDRNQPVTVTAPDGTVRMFDYDFRGRQTSLKDPDRGTSTTEYNDFGDVLSATDARQRKLTFTYDQLGRKTTESDGPTKLADWTYDSLAKGQPADTTRYAGGNAYKTAVTGYDAEYRPKGTSITIPATDTSLGALAKTYTFGSSYTADGNLGTTSFPAAGGLPAEEVTYGYSDLGLPTTLTSGTGSYVTETQYTDRGEPAVYTLQTSASQPRAQIGFQYDTGTRRLTDTLFTRESASPNSTISDTHYTRDPAGNATKIVQTPTKDGDPAGSDADSQCFSYDYLQRLTEAWTPAGGNCATAPANTAVGGRAPYWQSFRYALSGNRLTKTDHDRAGDTTTTYNYPSNGIQPHTITSASIADAAGTTTNGYSYDANGSMLTRASGQQLAWDAEGELASVTDAGATSTYVRNTDGTPLISREPSGTTLYLPGMELRLDPKTGAVSGTRFYTDATGATLAQRTPAGVTWLMPDPQGTTNTTVSTDPAQTVSERRQLPFGESRGSKPSVWANHRGFVGGAVQDIGLEQVGAREYDAALGSFISADAVLDVTDPQQLQGYAYASSSPVTKSDPSGNMTQSEGGGNGCNPCGKPGNNPDHGAKKPPSPNHSNSHHSDDGDFWGGVGKGLGDLGKGALNFYDEHKAMIVGVAVGIVAYAACTTITAGLGVIGCGAVAGMLGGMAAYSYGTAVEGKGEFSVGGLATAAAIGAVTGALGGVLLGGLGGGAAGAGLRATGSEVAGGAAAASARAASAAVRGGATRAASNAVGAGARAASRASTEEAGAGTGPSAGRAVTRECVGNSFAPDTPVAMADGTAKPIKDVRLGEQVVATDPETGQTQTEPVTAVVSEEHQDKFLVDLTVAEGTITATDYHLFWEVDHGRWVQAKDLASGSHLRTSDGHVATVVSTRTRHEGDVVLRNLTISQIHTYYVLAGGTSVLVHNCPIAQRALWKLTKEGATRTRDGGPFNTKFYQSKADGTWWTRDMKGDGGSAFKVYKETKKGLQWIHDASEYGTYIPDKWKGDVGRFIPWSQLHG